MGIRSGKARLVGLLLVWSLGGCRTGGLPPTPAEDVPRPLAGPQHEKADSPTRNQPPDHPLDLVRGDLAQRFDQLLDDPAAYRRRVHDECRRFPEGDLFPYTLPAMAYAETARTDPTKREAALPRMASLLDAAIASTVP